MQRHDKMAPADTPAPGGGPATVTPITVPPAAAAAMTVTPLPGVAAPPPAVPAVPPQAAEAKTIAPVVPEAKAQAVEKKADEPAPNPLAADFEAYKAKTVALEAALTAEKAETRRLAFEAAFDRAGVQAQAVDPATGKPKGPQYRDFLRSQLGDVDPRSDAGKAAIDAIVAQNPAMRIAAVSTEDPVATFLRAKAEEAKGTPSMWGLIPPDMVRGYDVGGRE